MVDQQCAHLGEPTGSRVPCSSCSKFSLLKLFSCAKFGQCTPAREVAGIPCCATCAHNVPRVAAQAAASSPLPYLPQEEGAAARPCQSRVRWAYGITTVPERRRTHLGRTVMSLRSAGFDRPRLFVDGCSHRAALDYEDEFRLQVTARDPHVRTAANWTLALLELFSRQPTADRYAIFQDDLAACRNVRPYLDRQRMPERGYWNLFCFMENDDPKVHMGRTWFEGTLLARQHPTKLQAGRSALALVFSRDGVRTLLSSLRFMERPATVNGHILIDGGVVSAMNEVGWREWVHRPSMFQHTGDVSTMGHQPHPKSESFAGEEFDALTLMPHPAPVQDVV